MAYRPAPSWSSGPFRSALTPWVFRLLVANTAIFAAGLILKIVGQPPYLFALGRLYPAEMFSEPWRVYTLLSYAFLHGGVGHWFFNMLALFFFGPRLEERWGSREFIKFYLIAAAGGAILSFLQPNAYIVGASGAINGLLMAWALYWPNEEVYFFGIFPIKIKWLVLAMGVFTILSAMDGASGTAHLAHLGGFVAALVYLKSPWAPNSWGELPFRPGQTKKKKNALVAWAGKKEPPAPSPSPTVPRPSSSAARRAERELLDDVDRILDKISQQGLASLTPEERARLDEVSRRYRTN